MARFKDNSLKVFEGAKGKSNALLEIAGAMVENTAIEEALIDTGFYMGAMQHKVGHNKVTIGNYAEYAPFIESVHKPVLRISLNANIANIRKLYHAKNI